MSETFSRRDGSCPNYRPDLDGGDCPCEPDTTGYCLSCGYWAPLYPADRSRPVLVPQGVMRRLIDEHEALEAVAEAARRFWNTTDSDPLVGLAADQVFAWDDLCAAIARLNRARKEQAR